MLSYRFALGITMLAITVLVTRTQIVRAHAQLVKATPAPGSVITEIPSSIDLTFSKEVSQVQIAVFDPSGQSATAGAAVIDPANAAHATVALVPALSMGTYTVRWRNVSTDGDEEAGRYVFYLVEARATDAIRTFINGREIARDAQARLVDGEPMLPLQALGEATGTVVEWDAGRRMIVASTPAMAHVHHEMYRHPEGTPAPTLKLTATVDSKGGFNLHLETTNWTWAAERVGGESRPNEGHAHLYVDGVQVGRPYGPWYHLSGLTPGVHDIRVTLNTNSHDDYATSAGEVVAASVTVLVRADGTRAIMQ